MPLRHAMIVIVILFFVGLHWAETQAISLNKSGNQWTTLEWSIEAASVVENHFDVIATVTFVHTGSGEIRQTEMFYAGGNIWKFRFTGTQTGAWTFNSMSTVPELNGLQGSVTVVPNPDPDVTGFVTHIGNKWVHSASGDAFVPQYVMAGVPQYYYDDQERIEADIQTFLIEHGFTGLHIPVFCHWFDINKASCADIADPLPDFRTFDTLETLIASVYAQGGVVHLWMWGDDFRGQNPSQFWGLNGEVDQRLQRYIAARLGPIPGWTMGYGFDLFEWVEEDELTTWHSYMQAHMGWEHLLGARSNTNQLDQLSEAMDYSSYEQHRPDYEMYVQTIEARADKPSFSEDRFRIRIPAQAKDYSTEDTRRGLWHSTMAGGIANIWGNLQSDMDINEGISSSLPYENAHQIKTYSLFFEDRFLTDMERCNGLTITDGYCLGIPGENIFVFYKEDADAILLNLANLTETVEVVAVDTRSAYSEIAIGALSAGNYTWQAPYISDWAIAVGDFSPVVITPSPTSGSAVPTHNIPTSTAPTPTSTQVTPTPNVTPISTFIPPYPHTTAQPVSSPAAQTMSIQLNPEPRNELRPAFLWQARLDTNGNWVLKDWYQLVVIDENTQILINTWLQGDAICNKGKCIFVPDETTLPIGFINGSYRWFIRVARDTSVSDWVEGNPFDIVVASADLPSHINLPINYVSPLTFTWGDDPKAAYYQIYIGTLDGTTTLMDGFWRDALSCDGITCAFSPDIAVWDQGEYYFYVRAWGPGGFSSGGVDNSGWNGIIFSIQPPSKIGSPTVTQIDNMWHFTWIAAQRAMWYQIWIGNSETSETYHLQWYSVSELGCSSGESCSLIMSFNVPDGLYTWYVQPWGLGGFHQGGIQGWLAGSHFSVPFTNP